MSTSYLPLCIEHPLTEEELRDAVDKAKDWALMHGISMRSKISFSKDQVQIAPFALLPSSFPRSAFERVKSLQTVMNELLHKVAYDKQFITHNLKSTIEADPFTAKLFHVYETVYAEGFAQSISLGLLRSDYMLHGNGGDEIKQIELNTIASSFAGIGTNVSQYHRYILTELGHADKLNSIPESNPLGGFCRGLIQAWSLYNDKKAVILFIIEDVTYNICDQRFHEYGIRTLNPSIKVIRRSLSSLIGKAQLGPDKELIVENHTVAVVYFRSGYQLEAYPTDQEWLVRLLIERSRAIKCPSIQYHLAGTKKVQQALAQDGALNSYLSDPSDIAKVQAVFAGLYALDFNDEGEAAVAMALKNPMKFVLKPQREGGGNNIYGEDVARQLTSMRNSRERTGWVLMERICPPFQKNYLMRANAEKDLPDLLNVLSELGIYGVVIGDEKNIIANEEVGHILRSKPSTANEGGILQGVGALDTPHLTP